MIETALDTDLLRPGYIDFASEKHRREVTKHLKCYRENLGSYTEVSHAAERLLDLYQPYLKSWLSFLTATSTNLRSGPFALFLSNPRFRRIPGDLRAKHRLIVKSLMQTPHADLKGEISLAFLESCRESDNVAYGIPYHLAPAIFALIRDPSVFGGRCSPLLDDISESIVVRSTYAQAMGDTKIIGSQDDLVYESEIRGSEPIVGECSFADLVKVYIRTDGLLGVSLSEDWILGKTVGLGGEESFMLLLPQEREILLRFYVAKQRHAEIAESMNVSPRHSRTLLARARAKLAEYKDEN